MPRQVYDFDDAGDCITAADELAKILKTEGFNVLRQLAARYVDIRISALRDNTPEGLALLRGRAEGVQSLMHDVQQVLQRAEKHLQGRRAEEAKEAARGAPPGLALPGRSGL